MAIADSLKGSRVVAFNVPLNPSLLLMATVIMNSGCWRGAGFQGRKCPWGQVPCQDPVKVEAPGRLRV